MDFEPINPKLIHYRAKAHSTSLRQPLIKIIRNDSHNYMLCEICQTYNNAELFSVWAPVLKLVNEVWRREEWKVFMELDKA